MKNAEMAALLGVAIGDALGATVEFMDKVEIRRQYKVHRNIVGGGWLHLKAGDVTDDTQLTIAVANGICKDPTNPIPHIGEEFIAWYASNPVDVGVTIGAAIRRARVAGWTNAAKDAHDTMGKSAGNGGLMRTVYPGLFYADRVQAENIAAAQSGLTHYDTQSASACMIYTRIIHRLVNEKPKTKAKKRRVIIDEIRNTEYANSALWRRDRLKPTGYVVDSFRCAIWAIMNTATFEDAIVKAVNLGGDADTIGAIAGGIAGAFYGPDSIPKMWIAALNPETVGILYRLAERAQQEKGDK